MPKAQDTETARAKAAINAAIDIFHRRCVLRIIWELLDLALTFRQLQEACSEVSPSVLNQRLAELREVGLVLHVNGEGYQLSEHGKALLVAMRPMLKWSVAWYSGNRKVRQVAAGSVKAGSVKAGSVKAGSAKKAVAKPAARKTAKAAPARRRAASR